MLLRLPHSSLVRWVGEGLQHAASYGSLDPVVRRLWTQPFPVGLIDGKLYYIMFTMKETTRNPLIRVYPQTRKKLKIIAAHHEESMQATVERLAQAEMERLQKGGQADVPGAPSEHRQDRPAR